MAITFVGSGGGGLSTTGSVSYAFSGLADETGATPTLQQNDLVVVTTSYRTPTATGEWNQTPTDPSSVAYTAAYADLFVSNTNAISFKTSYKFMGASPDASVTIPAADAAGDGCYTIHVFRGVNTTTPLDVTPTTAGFAGAGNPNAPAITPTTSGAWIYAAGAYTAHTTTAVTAPTGFNSSTNDFVSASSTGFGAIGAGFYSGWTSGAYDPAAFGGGASTSASCWGAATVALRPLGTGGGGTTYNDTISESITSGDSLTGAAIFVGTISEAITAGDSETGGLLLTGTISESITQGYSITGSAAFAAVLTETLGLSDSATSVGTFSVTYSETLTFADLYASAGGSIWTVQSPPTGSWVTQSPPTGLWTKQVPPTVIWTKE